MTAGAPTAGINAEAAERYWRNTLFAVFAVTVARLVWLALGKADLYPDEAQYWAWSLHPAFGYYSKPPLVAWLIALTTGVFGESEVAVRLAAPLLHFATALTLFALARRLYDARVAAWSAVIYATLPGVTVSAIIMSTDAPLMLCWTVALYCFVRAREDEDWRWWLAVGAAAGVGLLAKYAMAYWLLSGLLFLAMARGEQRHLPRYLGACALALLIYAPNFVWNWMHRFASYRHTADNAALSGPLFHTHTFFDFFGSQFGVFGPLLFAVLLAILLQGRRTFAEKRAALLACFALPTLAMMLTVSFLSHAQPNWSAPTFVSATILVVAWLLARELKAVLAASLVLHIGAAVVLLELRDIAHAAGYELPGKNDPLHRLRGWSQLGTIVARDLRMNPGVHLLVENREDMAALLYYVHPHPFDALKWNGDDDKPNDQFDIDADPARSIGQDFLMVSSTPDIKRITSRFTTLGPIQHIFIPLGGGEGRDYIVELLGGFKGYREH
jgi:4-amino-4-deoxy-L-arabinose transferase-like glycosyltransferase